jgi:uncharacterized protein (DUF697 family)
MGEYEKKAAEELSDWQKRMQKSPSIINRLSRRIQTRINRIIPEKAHAAITVAIREMVRAVLTGAKFITHAPYTGLDLHSREAEVRRKITIYTNTSSAEGAVAGAGGILLSLADFPIWLTIKMKMLFDIAALYGHDVKDYKERVYILHIFQLTFSSQQYRRKIFTQLKDWDNCKGELPDSIKDFDWRNFQQEYRDYIDLAKLLQLIPGIGAAVGAYVNYRLTRRLGLNAMQAYRMREQTRDLLTTADK